jgi:acetyltransferase-like isoleucine patch superfamily enzyme
MAGLYRYLARSDHWSARCARAVRRGVSNFSMPGPKVVVRPMLAAFVGCRSIYYFLRRVLLCEPLFKAYCKQYGRGVRTGVYIHWVEGKGDIILGDGVEVDGKCSFHFASRFCEHPMLKIGDHSIIRHGCDFTIAKSITIGRYCKIANDVILYDSSGHPSAPEARKARQPPRDEDVRPIVIGDNVWIGRRAIVSPGVTIGDNSIVSSGSVVVMDVPPNVVVAGFPARKIASLDAPRTLPPDPARAPTNGAVVR